MQNAKKYVSGIILGILVISNSLTGISSSMNTTYASSSPYELRKIVYEGGIEEFASEHGSGSGNESEDAENMLNLNDYWDIRFINDHLYVFEGGESAKLEIYDRNQNPIISVGLPSGANSMLFDEATQKIAITYTDDPENIKIYWYNLDGTYHEDKVYSTESLGHNLSNNEYILFWYSPIDEQIVAINYGDYTQTISVTSLYDGSLLHTFTAEDFGTYDRISIESILQNGYIIAGITYGGPYDLYIVNNTDGSITALPENSWIVNGLQTQYAFQVTDDTHITIRDNTFNELHSFDINADWADAWNVVYYPDTQRVVLVEQDSEGIKISTYDANTGTKIYENTDFVDSDGVWFNAFDASTGIIYLSVEDYGIDRSIYKYDPVNDTATLISYSFYDYGYGYGYGYGDESPQMYGDASDNFNSITLDETNEKNLIIGAGDRVKTLSQSGELVSAQSGERACLGEGCEPVYPYYTDTEKYKDGFVGLDGKTNVAGYYVFLDGSHADTFEQQEQSEINEQNPQEEIDPQKASIIGPDSTVINGGDWEKKLYGNNGNFKTDIYFDGYNPNIIVTSEYIANIHTSIDIYDLDGNELINIPKPNNCDYYAIYTENMYCIENNYSSQNHLKKINIQTGEITTELTFPFHQDNYNFIGHIDSSGLLYLMSGGYGSGPKDLFTYDTINHTLTTVQEGVETDDFIQDFFILENGNIVVEEYGQAFVVGSSEKIPYNTGGYGRKAPIFPLNNGFVLMDTSGGKEYSYGFIPTVVSFYDNNGNFVWEIYRAKHPSWGTTSAIDNDDNFLFVDDRYVWSIDMDGNLTQKNLIGNGGGGQMIRALGMVTDESSDQVFVSDTGNKRIKVHSVMETTEDESGNIRPVISDEMLAIHGYTRDDGDGEIYDSEGNWIDPYDLLPTSRTIGFGELSAPSGIDISPVNGDIYVVDNEARNVRIYGKDGTSKGVFVSDLPLFTRDISCSSDFTRFYTDNSEELPGENCIPVGLTIDNSGKVYISHDKWIRVYNADGTLYTEINETTHPGAFESNSFLRGIDVDDNGDIYVVDSSIEVRSYIPHGSNGDIYVVDSSIEFEITQQMPMIGYKQNMLTKKSLAKAQTISGEKSLLDQVFNFIIPGAYAQSDEGCYDYGYGSGYWDADHFMNHHCHNRISNQIRNYSHHHRRSNHDQINRILVFSLTDNTDNSGNNGSGGGENNGNGNGGNPSNPSTPSHPNVGPGGSSVGSGNGNGNKNTVPEKDKNTSDKKTDKTTDKKTPNKKQPLKPIVPFEPLFSAPVSGIGGENQCVSAVKNLDDPLLLSYYDILHVVDRSDVNRKITRAEFLKLVLNASGITGTGDVSGTESILGKENTSNTSGSGFGTQSQDTSSTRFYSDLNQESWYIPYFAYAIDHGIMRGQEVYGDGNGSENDTRIIRPNDTISRAEAAKILTEMVQGNKNPLSYTEADIHTFADIASDNSLASYVQYTYNNCILHGRNTVNGEPVGGRPRIFEPNDGITLAETAKVLYNLSYGEK